MSELFSGDTPTSLIDPQAVPRHARRWVVAYSGGVDSTALLLSASSVLTQLDSDSLPELVALHVNHKMQENADGWERHCLDTANLLGVSCEVRNADVDVRSGDGPEAAARAARYQVFEDFLDSGDLLLLGHNADDRIETWFLHALRGSGPRGLASIPISRELGRAFLWRPLMTKSRSEIEAYVESAGVPWIVDPSNHDTALDRNYLRSDILPVLGRRWPRYRDAINRSIDLAADQQGDYELWLKAVIASGQSRGPRGEPCLQLARLPAQPLTLSLMLREWLRHHRLEAPGKESLTEFARQLVDADTAILARPDYRLQKYEGSVYLLAPRAASASLGPWRTCLGQQPIELGPAGSIEVRPTHGSGLRLDPDETLEVRIREGGERCRPAGRQHSQTLKKLLQESAIAPWYRECLPLLYRDGELVAVADLWLVEGQLADKDQMGAEIVWRPPILDINGT